MKSKRSCGHSVVGETNWWRTQTIEENCGILKLCDKLVQSLRKAVADIVRTLTKLKLINCEKIAKDTKTGKEKQFKILW